MDWSALVRSRLTASGGRPDEDVVEELAQHASAAFAAARAEGADPADAERQVRALIDQWCAAGRQLTRRPRRPPAVEPPAGTRSIFAGLFQDVRYSARLLRRQPGSALVATLLISLGIGAATTLCSVTYAVLYQPLAWPEASQLVRITEARDGATRPVRNVMTNAVYLAWRDSRETIEGLAAWSSRNATLAGRGEPERVNYVAATASLFSVLRIRAAAGTLFSPTDEADPSRRVIVLSHGLWQRRFGGDAGAIGASVTLDGNSYEVIGVAPRGFAFPDPDTQAWTRLVARPVVDANGKGRSVQMFGGIARLKPGATAAQASAEGTARGRAAPDLGMVGTAVFGTQGKPVVTATPYLESLTAEVRRPLLILLAGVVLLLVAAAASVAGMQLARATPRRREFAVRAAIGASRAQLARERLAENAILGCAGGLGGWALSIVLHAALPTLLPADFPRIQEIAVDWRVLAFAGGLAIATTVLFGTMPVLVARRTNLVQSLVEDSLAPIGGGLRTRTNRVRLVIMTGQIAVAALLLVGAALRSSAAASWPFSTSIAATSPRTC